VSFRGFTALLLLVLACVGTLGACGDDEEEGGGGAAREEATGQTEGVEVIDPGAIEQATGEITFCSGKDTSGLEAATIEDFNREYRDQGLSARLLEFPESADEQRNQFIQRQRARSGECDAFSADVIWTAEFASQRWLVDLTPYVEQRQQELIPSTLETVRYDGKFFGVPFQTDAGFLYYRTDQVDQVPATWQAVYEDAARRDGLVYQGAAYEGLTVNFLELAFAAGGSVLSEDGTEATIDSPENLEALNLMVEGIRSGAVPQAVTTYMEEQARRAFEAGRATYMRNWPYAFGLGNRSEIRGDFEVVPYPPFEGGDRAGILGGHNTVISAFSQNKPGALAYADFKSREAMQTRQAAEFTQAPVLPGIYEKPEVREALPFAQELLQAVQQARSRPVSPVYPLISQAIYENVNSALSGRLAPEQALQRAQQEIEQALETF